MCSKENYSKVNPSKKDNPLSYPITRFPSPILPITEMSEDQRIEKIAEHFQKIMELLGLDLSNDSLTKTPLRIAKMYVKEVFAGLREENFPDITVMEDIIEHHEKNSLILTKVSFISFCEHHFVPMVGTAYVGYIPNKKLIGLSKIPRIVRYFASRPQLQERLTAQIGDCLANLLDTKNIGVVVEAKHFCVIARGIRDESSETSTHFVSGIFEQDLNRRNEFFNSVLRMMQKDN